jgi:dihydrofolate reductase
MKLMTHTQVTVDGVMQGNGGATQEDTKSGFQRGGWAMGVFDDRTVDFIVKTYQSADAFLFGRQTYEVFAASWGKAAEMRAHPIGEALNAKPKYVVSNTIVHPKWAGTTVISGDVEAEIRKLRASAGGELQVHGSGALIRWLLQRELVDEMTLLIVPVVLGQGVRLFPENGPDIALDLVDSRADPRGVTVQIYRPRGRPQYRPAPAPLVD